MRVGMRSKQRGATFLGILIIGGILAFGIYAGIRLVPLYMEFMAVNRALNQIKSEGDSSVAGIKRSLERRWEIEDVKSIAVKDIEIKPVGGGLEVHAAYEARAPFVSNVSLVVEFDKSVIVGAGGP
jgi:hypothetical protein